MIIFSFPLRFLRFAGDPPRPERRTGSEGSDIAASNRRIASLQETPTRDPSAASS